MKNSRKIKQRSFPAVVRTPYLKLYENPEAFYYSLLLQYCPFRIEGDLMTRFSSTEDIFLTKKEQLQALNNQINVYRNDNKKLKTTFNQVHAFNIL